MDSCRIGLLAFAVIISGCWSIPSAKKPAPTPEPIPVAAEAVTVDRPVNVSFSTYSKDWPVGWQWIDPGESHNPARYDVKKGVLRVVIPTNRNLYGDNRLAPRYLKNIAGDFQIETRVRFLPKENYQGAGLLIFKDKDNYIRFERAYGGIGGGGEGIRLDVRTSAGYKPLSTPNDIPTDAPQVDLRIMRNGQAFSAFWRLNEDMEWRMVGEFTSDYPENVLAGVVACNTAREVTAEFGYIRLLPAGAQ